MSTTTVLKRGVNEKSNVVSAVAGDDECCSIYTKADGTYTLTVTDFLGFSLTRSTNAIIYIYSQPVSQTVKVGQRCG